MWDPLRRKEVAETPEERVRQWFIGVLSGSGFPMGLMGSEVPPRRQFIHDHADDAQLDI